MNRPDLVAVIFAFQTAFFLTMAAMVWLGWKRARPENKADLRTILRFLVSGAAGLALCSALLGASCW